MLKIDHLTKRYSRTSRSMTSISSQARRRYRLPRTERVGQIHDDAHHPRTGPCDKGRATINGVDFTSLKDPLREVGACWMPISPSGTHGPESPEGSGGVEQIKRSRVDEVLEFVGISSVANKKVGGFSLGMCQRLGIAGGAARRSRRAALRRAVNGLDPEGIRWIREFFQSSPRRDARSS